MGGEGSMMAANQSLKTNRSMLSNRERVKVSLVSGKDEKWVDPKQPTFEELMAIRIRIRKQQKNRFLKRIWITIIALILSLLSLYYWIA
jgi:tRNA U34 2-thiouridine synthase MnmA/TrmU